MNAHNCLSSSPLWSQVNRIYIFKPYFSKLQFPCYPLYLGQPHERLPSGSPIAILSVFISKNFRINEQINNATNLG